MKNILSVMTVSALCLMASTVLATEAQQAQPPKPQTTAPAPAPAEAKKPETAAAAAYRKLDERGKKMMEGMDENQLRQFASIRTSYGAIRSVQNVQQSIGRAIKACGDVNPGIRDDMDNGFENWRMYIRPTMRKAEAKMEKMIMLQTFGKPSDVRSYLALFDEAVKARNAEIKEVPVSEKAECINLLKKMAETQKKMVDILNKTLYLDQPIKQKQGVE